MIGILTQSRRRSGITLTEILIAIMIMGVGLVSLATLFPIGLLRLRDATRYTRSAILLQTAASDASARGLLGSKSFAYADYVNYQANQLYGLSLPFWYATPTYSIPNGYNPLIEDTQFYGGESHTVNQQNVVTVLGARVSGAAGHPLSGPGLPFAYDPLWRFKTGNYLDPINQSTLEARFGYGIGFLRNDSDGNPPSAHGLQRITNFNLPSFTSGQNVVPIMPASQFVPSIFVSQEDTVWQEPNNPNYSLAWNSSVPVGSGPSPVIPDLSISYVTNAQGTKVPTYQPMLDWRYSWMFTGQLTSAGNASCLDGSIVIFENRQFGINAVKGPYGATYQVDGETVVEAIFGYSTNVVPNGGPGYGSSADRTVLLRWPATEPDPVVRVGDWIADVTYERNQLVVYSRWWQGFTDANGYPIPLGVPNPTNNGEWDNLPPQRCYWYQVQKVMPASTDATLAGFRSMTVYVNQSLVCRTLLNGTGQPVYQNAALIAPNVVNVIPQTIFAR